MDIKAQIDQIYNSIVHEGADWLEDYLLYLQILDACLDTLKDMGLDTTDYYPTYEKYLKLIEEENKEDE